MLTLRVFTLKCKKVKFNASLNSCSYLFQRSMGRYFVLSHLFVTDHNIYIAIIVSILSIYTSANPPIIDFSHNMRILKLPNNTKVGTIIYRLKGTDADNDVIEFGARGIIGNRLLGFKKVNFHETDVYLKTPLEVSHFNFILY